METGEPLSEEERPALIEKTNPWLMVLVGYRGIRDQLVESIDLNPVR